MDMIAVSNGRYESDGFTLAIDFAVHDRGVVAVLGPSGAGKSTLLNVLAGFEPLKSGHITLCGQDHTLSPPAARPVSFVFQDNNSFAHMTARDNVALGLAPSLRLSDAQWHEVDAALERVGIAALSGRKPGEMSGGERQRIALARCLVRNRPVLLLDEAFAALGPSLRNELLDQVKALQAERGLTVLMVTHQPEDAKRIADAVIFINDGIVHGPVGSSLFFNARNPDVEAYLGHAG